MPSIRTAVLTLLLFGAIPASSAAFELPVDVELSFDASSTSFDALADFTRFENNPDRPEARHYELEDAGLLGFRVGLAPHSDFELGWTRLFGSSRYRVFLDGEEIGEGVRDGIEVQLAKIDLRFDSFSVRYRPSQWGSWGLRPVLSVGWGLVLLSQQEPLRPPDSLAVDWSDSDKGWEITGGVEGRWSRLRAGLQLRTFHWRFDTEDERIPPRTTHAWMLGAWVGLTI